MNPIDQAFLNAYAKKKSAQPQKPSASAEQVRPLVEKTGDRRVYAHLPPKSVAPPPPHFETATLATTSHAIPTRRSPSIIVPTGEGPSVLVNTNGASALPKEPTIRIRVDQPSDSSSRLPVPHVSMPVVPVATHSESPSLEGERRTLSSYLQKSRESIESVMPRSGLTESSATALPEPIEKPAITTRWSTPTNPPVQSLRIDPSHERYPPVVRPDTNMPWSPFGVERSTKSTASSQSTAARTLNPTVARSTSSITPSQPSSTASVSQSENVWGRIPGKKVSPSGDYEAMPSSGTRDQRSSREPPIDTSVPHPHVLAPKHFHELPIQDASPTSRSRSQASQRETMATTKMALPIQAIWEVDQFFWPATVANLLETQQTAFTDIGLHLQHIQSKGLRVLSVTGGERGVGRSTVAMCLAKTVAMAGLRVAILDGDYECPSLVDHLNLAVDYGWQQCLTENIPLDEVVIQSIEDNVAVVPLTDSIPGSTIQDHATRINKLIKRLSQAYDFVIIDANRLTHKNPRLLGTGDESVLDAALVIVDAELSLRQRVDVAIDLIRQQGIQSIGIAENFHSEAKS